MIKIEEILLSKDDFRQKIEEKQFNEDSILNLITLIEYFKHDIYTYRNGLPNMFDGTSFDANIESDLIEEFRTLTEDWEWAKINAVLLDNTIVLRSIFQKDEEEGVMSVTINTEDVKTKFKINTEVNEFNNKHVFNNETNSSQDLISYLIDLEESLFVDEYILINKRESFDTLPNKFEWEFLDEFEKKLKKQLKQYIIKNKNNKNILLNQLTDIIKTNKGRLNNAGSTFGNDENGYFYIPEGVIKFLLNQYIQSLESCRRFLNEIDKPARIKFKNNLGFLNLNELIIYDHFYKGLVENQIISEETLDSYLLMAFEKRKPFETKDKIELPADYSRRKFHSIYFSFWNKAEKPFGKQTDFIKLITDYFIGFNLETVRTNWSK